uniref:Calcineurin-like phosphoesterase domain-containing protein n=1 Tax=candidate division WOR-3 bacterium TaxID=2052148 RepID=A0A7V3VUT3_UNCW3
MVILHTADLHLTSKEPSRLKVLEWIIDKANASNVDCIIIAGDLFDSDTEATILRTEVRRIFQRSSSRLLLLPGNHDVESYGINYDYGENVHKCTKRPFEQFIINDITFVAVPFQPTKFSECVIDLSENPDVFIAHGTLYDLSILPVLNSEDIGYMPIYPPDLKNHCRIALLGHIHSAYLELDYDKTKIIYPGAPISLNTKCRTPRKISLIEIDKKKIVVNSIEVDIAQFWKEMSYFVFPGNEEKVLNQIEQELNGFVGENILPSITVQGFIAGNEGEFKKEIIEIKERYRKEFMEIALDCNEIQSWDRVLKNPFVRKFVERTQHLPDELRMKIFQLIFPHFVGMV